MTQLDNLPITARQQNASSTYLPYEGIFFPETHDDVVELVRQANIDQIPLYAVSTGLNWGYGSNSPVVRGCKLVDLRKMRKILNGAEGRIVSASNPVALIEPGVTQGDLYDFLKREQLPLTFNVTGSARETSIIGNCLDRGVGYFGPRREDLFGLRVVLGNGKTLDTGFRRLGDASPLAHTHPYGLGPILDGLFFQGNFGIVTSACFRLLPRRPKEVAISLALHDEEKLSEFVDVLIQLKREALLTSVTHIANKARSQASLQYGMADYLENQCSYSPNEAKKDAEDAVSIVAPNQWTSLAALTGTEHQVIAALTEIKKRVSHLARVLVINSKLLNLAFKACHAFNFIQKFRLHAAAINAIKPLHGLALGIPTDAAIENLLWKYNSSEPAARLDYSNCGIIFISPALPSDGSTVATLVRKLEEIAKDHRQEIYVTLNIETATSLVAVINFLFNKSDPDAAKKAHLCAAELLRCIHGVGLEIYRSRTDIMSEIVSEKDDYWKTVRGLKKELDPMNIISPGRYNLA